MVEQKKQQKKQQMKNLFKYAKSIYDVPLLIWFLVGNNPKIKRTKK